jgi:flagellar basal-body rod modification protein FlgD
MSDNGSNIVKTSSSGAFVGSGNDVRATMKGTRIVKPGSEMDKNAFLRILAAELTNQDPMNAKDSTAYVTQMAQFASMEQMANLNSTMTTYSANSLAGKHVVMRVNDPNGIPYSGVVRDVTSNGGRIKLGVEVNVNGKAEIWDFDYNEVLRVVNAPDYNLEYLAGSTALYTAAALIGKKAELNIKDGEDNNITGTVKGLIREGALIKLRVVADGTGEELTVSLSNIMKLDMV